MPMPDDETLGALIRREATRHAPPAGLAQRILADTRVAAAPQAASSPRRHEPASSRPAWRRWFESTLVFGAGAATAWFVAGSLLVPAAVDRTVDELAGSHVAELTPRLWKQHFADNPLRSDLHYLPA